MAETQSESHDAQPHSGELVQWDDPLGRENRVDSLDAAAAAAGIDLIMPKLDAGTPGISVDGGSDIAALAYDDPKYGKFVVLQRPVGPDEESITENEIAGPCQNCLVNELVKLAGGQLARLYRQEANYTGIYWHQTSGINVLIIGPWDTFDPEHAVAIANTISVDKPTAKAQGS